MEHLFTFKTHQGNIPLSNINLMQKSALIIVFWIQFFFNSQSILSMTLILKCYQYRNSFNSAFVLCWLRGGRIMKLYYWIKIKDTESYCILSTILNQSKVWNHLNLFLNWIDAVYLLEKAFNQILCRGFT